MSFRKDASRVIKSTQSMIKGKLIPEPIWVKSAMKYPNLQNFSRTPSSFPTEAPLPFEKQPLSKFKVKYSNQEKLVGKASVKKLKFKFPIPQPITYPEDKLRQQFFKHHPFEKVRPKLLVENDTIELDTWSKYLNEDLSAKVDIEALLKYQLYLLQEGYSEEEAYEIVTKKLVKLRVQEEMETYLATKHAKQLGTRFAKDCNQLGYENEAAMLEESRKQIELTEAINKSQAFSSEKSFKNDSVTNPNL